MPANTMFGISGGNPPNPATGEVSFAFDTTLKQLKLFDGTNLFRVNAVSDESSGISAVGARNGSTVVATEYGVGPLHHTLLTLTATPITMADATAGGGVKIYDFPEGRILFLGSTGTMTFTTTSTLASTLNASVTANWGVGTVVQANGTLATTEQNILPTTNVTSSATINVAGSTTSGALSTQAVVDGTTTPIDAYLNIGVATATDIDGDATVTATGTIRITWLAIGDY